MRLKALALVSVLAFAPVMLAQATASNRGEALSYKVLHAFTGGSDGGGLWGSLTLDKQGNVYGTTSGGGIYNSGVVFALTPDSNGDWTETVLTNFGGNDGGGSTSGLVFDSAGNLYGTTSGGGVYGYGTVFELSPGLGDWAESVLYSFPQPPTRYGCCPQGNLILDRAGNLYGTSGAAFELSPAPGGWTMAVLHDFFGQNGDGYDPFAGPIMDGAGTLYGTTADGGGRGGCVPYGCGTVYELQRTPAGVSTWKERILHRFGSFMGDGVVPSLGQLAVDRFGNLYGATDGGGTTGYGTVYKLTRIPTASGGVWAETILHNFGNDAKGSFPGGGVILDKSGTLYGTTIAGGSPLCGCGVVYKLAPQSDGGWQYTVLHTFVGSDGAQPDANLTIGPDGNLYGTTATGGAGGYGVVFQIQIAQ